MKDGTLECGVLNLYKPAGMTSFQAISKVKRILGIKKCGHAGTLDPDAQGVLPVFIGTATGACNYLEDEQKEYHVEFLIGIATDTGDCSGRITCVSDFDIPFQCIRDVLPDFTGELMQTPPIYSAVKVKGKKLYEYARKGDTDIEIPERKVTVYSISVKPGGLQHTVVRVDGREAEVASFEGIVRCSRGTYIRSLCRDIGQALGTCGCMGKLIRSGSGPYRIEQSVQLEELQSLKEKGDLVLMPVSDLFAKFGKVILDDKQTEDYLNGKRLYRMEILQKDPQQLVAVYSRGHGFIGMGELFSDGTACYLKGKKMFCNPFI